MSMDIPETSHHTIPHYDSHIGHTLRCATNKWIKERLGYKGVEMWKGRSVWGGGMGGERRVKKQIVHHVTIVTTP